MKKHKPRYRSQVDFWIWLIVAATASGVLVTAALLEPNPAGVGTHRQLGLPPCGFLLWTGIPCPGCGLTTSFAHMIRGNFQGAWQANASGMLLFSLTLVAVPISTLAIFRRWKVQSFVLSRTFLAFPLLIVGTMLTNWIVHLL